MNDLETVAFCHAVAAATEKAARAGVQPGEYRLDFSARLSGTLVVGDDEIYVPTSSVPWTAVTAALLRRLGATREAAVGMLIEILRDLDEGTSETELAAEAAATGKAALAAVKAALPPATRKGKVKWTGVITPVV